MKVSDLTGDKGAFFLKPVADGSNGRNIHEPQTETTHNPVRDLWRESKHRRSLEREWKRGWEWRPHHQHVDIWRESWYKDSCRRNASSSCEEKNKAIFVQCFLLPMHVNRGPNLFTIAEDMGPTSIMKPARMLPTWVARYETLSKDADGESYQWDLAFPSSLKVRLQRFDKDPKRITNAIQDLILRILSWWKNNNENKPCCRGSWRRQWSNPIHRPEVEEGHLVLLSSAGTLLAEEQQIEVEALFYTHSGRRAFLWLQNRLTREVKNWFLPAAFLPPHLSYPSSSLPPPHHPSSTPSFPLSAFKQTARTDPAGSGITFRVTSTAYAFLNSSSTEPVAPCYVKSKSASNLTPGVVVHQRC